jgi:sarcosine oxidase gamma subunit
MRSNDNITYETAKVHVLHLVDQRRQESVLEAAKVKMSQKPSVEEKQAHDFSFSSNSVHNMSPDQWIAFMENVAKVAAATAGKPSDYPTVSMQPLRATNPSGPCYLCNQH